jgi:hypothetical protein
MVNPVSPDAPTYPWPSMAVRCRLHHTLITDKGNKIFLTDLLFSSSHLRFSEQQKLAVLNWAKELGANGAPSLAALKKCQAQIRSLVGSPTEKFVSNSGNVFYLNDIGKAIAKGNLYNSKCGFINI